MKYYSAMRKGYILSFVKTWMDPEHIMLSMINQRKTSTVQYHLYVKSKKAKPLKKERE